MLQQLLKVSGEEQLVPENRTANFSAELVGMIGRVQVGEVILGIEVGVADILEELAMELVGAGLGRQVDHGATEGAVLGGRVVGFHLHLSNVGKRDRDGNVSILRLDVHDTIHQVEISLKGKSIH